MKKLLIAVVVVILASFTVPAFAATNPFMDVPANHWAFDAVTQLASRGIISGYPDGSYKGTQPATRYEVASLVARAIANIDMEKASKQDLEMLKKLVVEFKGELDALGVKVNDLDERVAVLEKDLGGWSMAGELRFDAKFSSDNMKNGWYDDDCDMTGKNEFDLNYYRLFIRKRIDENTNFTARLGRNEGTGMVWERYYVTTKVFTDAELTVGRQFWNWEDDLGLVGDNDAIFGAYCRDMLRLKKTWGMANFDLIVARNFDDGSGSFVPGKDKKDDGYKGGMEQFLIAAKVGFDINEKLMLGATGYWVLSDNEIELDPPVGGEKVTTDNDMHTFGFYAGYSFTPSIQLKGIYYMQNQGDSIAAYMSPEKKENDADAWKVILDVNQDLLKFSSLWLEYARYDNNFVITCNPYAWGGAEILENRPHDTNTTTVFGIHTNQKWNDTWRTFARYYRADFDTKGIDIATNWSVGVGYRLSPAIEMELMYDAIDYGKASEGVTQNRTGDDNIVRFRTYVTF